MKFSLFIHFNHNWLLKSSNNLNFLKSIWHTFILHMCNQLWNICSRVFSKQLLNRLFLSIYSNLFVKIKNSFFTRFETALLLFQIHHYLPWNLLFNYIKILFVFFILLFNWALNISAWSKHLLTACLRESNFNLLLTHLK